MMIVDIAELNMPDHPGGLCFLINRDKNCGQSLPVPGSRCGPIALTLLHQSPDDSGVDRMIESGSRYLTEDRSLMFKAIC